ncbi:AfsR/SARP family transcriptional regulator [Deinococcus multiflagellatus]|uniref:Bacterial transcriptional activator domain-containing protein n=1 Tax=Deinococcus multiflagellatus TaxID=1656887 RepID=A0ABW1ZI87_9DEIO
MSLPVTLHVLGPTYMSRGGTTIHLSAKGLALLTFLTLEGQPHHRDTAASLLWDSPRALASLRVELTKLRAAGLALGAPRSALLAARLPTDLARWRQTPAADLDTWLGLLRGLPLSGLDDLNSPALTAWVDRTRQRLLDEIELALQAAWMSAEPRRRERLARQLDLLGLELPSPAPKPPPMEAVWQAARLAQRQPQVLVLAGATGSGRHQLITESLDKRWVVISVPALPSAAMLFSAARVMVQQAAGAPLPHPATSPDEAVAGLTQALLRLGRPVALVVSGAERLPETLLPHLAYLAQWPLPLLVIFTVHPSQTQRCLEHLTAHLPPERLHLAEVPRLTLSGLVSVLRGLQAPEEPGRALYLLQQSEGWQAAALALRAQTAQIRPRAQLPSRERHLLLADLDAALPHARAPWPGWRRCPRLSAWPKPSRRWGLSRCRSCGTRWKLGCCAPLPETCTST